MVSLALCGCAADNAPSSATATAPVQVALPALACSLPSNCVNSLGTGGLGPLKFPGTSAQGMALLRATLRGFPEATITASDPLTLQAIFTTTVGFRDQVDFVIDAEAQRIDFRSRSLFGLFDWGKNRSRMTSFSRQFDQEVKAAQARTKT